MLGLTIFLTIYLFWLAPLIAVWGLMKDPVVDELNIIPHSVHARLYLLFLSSVPSGSFAVLVIITVLGMLEMFATASQSLLQPKPYKS